MATPLLRAAIEAEHPDADSEAEMRIRAMLGSLALGHADETWGTAPRSDERESKCHTQQRPPAAETPSTIEHAFGTSPDSDASAVGQSPVKRMDASAGMTGPAASTVLLTNVPASFNTTQLRILLGKFGAISECKLIKTPQGQSAVAVFARSEDAASALRERSSLLVGGKPADLTLVHGIADLRPVDESTRSPAGSKPIDSFEGHGATGESSLMKPKTSPAPQGSRDPARSQKSPAPKARTPPPRDDKPPSAPAASTAGHPSVPAGSWPADTSQQPPGTTAYYGYNSAGVPVVTYVHYSSGVPSAPGVPAYPPPPHTAYAAHPGYYPAAPGYTYVTYAHHPGAGAGGYTSGYPQAAYQQPTYAPAYYHPTAYGPPAGPPH